MKIYYPFFTNEDILGFGRLVNPFNLALIIVGVTLIVFLIYAPEGIFPEKRDNNEEYQDLLYLLDDGVVSGNKLSLKILSTLVNVDVGKLKWRIEIMTEKGKIYELDAKNVYKYFGGVKAVDGATVMVEKGKLTALIGSQWKWKINIL